MKRLMFAVAATMSVALSAWAETAYWKDGGSGPFTDASHWKNGAVPSEGWTVRFDGTQGAVVDDSAMEFFKSFGQVVLAGGATRLTISNEVDTTINKGQGWLISDGIVKKVGKGKLTMDHSTSSKMIHVYGGFEVRDGEVVFATSDPTPSDSKQVTPQCPVGVFKPGVLTLPNNNVVKVRGLYGDGHVKNPPYSAGFQFFIVGGTRAKPGEYFGTFENNPVCFEGENCYQRFCNASVDIGGNMKGGYLGTVKYPSVVFRDVCEYEYLGAGETVSSSASMTFLNNSTYCFTLNGGTNGALRIENQLYYNAHNTYVGEIVWSGDSAQTNVFAGRQTVSGARPVYWKKTGTGTWRFTGTGTRANAGVVATEKGRLEYDDMAEAGAWSPLGYANNLLSEYYGAAVDETKRVPYAYLLGDGTNDVNAATATMAYVGETAKKITTRPVALKGAGRFEATAAALDWKGFTSAATGTNTLVLAGVATGSVARDVTNGVGKVVVVKEGTGDWTLDGNYDFNAGVEARGGKLTLKGDGYEWYRLSLMENYAMYDPNNSGIPLKDRTDHDGGNVWLCGFGLFDAEGNNLIQDLAINSAANGNPAALAPGQAALGDTNFEFQTPAATYPLTNLFTTADTAFGGHRWTVGRPVLDNPDSWVRVVVRMRAGSRAPVAYDLRAFAHKSWTNGLVREPRSWKLEGSLDGTNWTDLHQVISNETKAVTSRFNWFSSNTASYTTGYEGVKAPMSRPTTMDYVGVGGTATLETLTPITFDCLRYDAALGGGTIDGFTLAPSGTIEITNLARGGALTLPVTFANCTGSIDNWTVKMNGRVRSGYKAEQTAGGIKLIPPGMAILIK